MSERYSTAGTRPADRPARTVRWAREASTDHSHEDGERAADAVLLTPQDPRTTRHRRVPAPHRPATAPGKLRNTRLLFVLKIDGVSGGVHVRCHPNRQTAKPP